MESNKGPKQQHYLGKNSCLKFFTAGNRNKICMYQRHQEYVMTDINNVAKESELYSLIKQDESYDKTIEKKLNDVEIKASKIIEKIIQSNLEYITAQDRDELFEYIAAQEVRTPSQMDTLAKMYGEVYKLLLQSNANHKENFNQKYNDLFKNKSESEIEKTRQYILEGECDIKEGNKNILLLDSFNLVKTIFQCLIIKKIKILISGDLEFIISDTPVLQFKNPDLPERFNKGFMNADIFLPLSKNYAIFLRNNENKIDFNSDVKIEYEEISKDQVLYLNQSMVNKTERFVFGSNYQKYIQDYFNQTKTPIRFTFQTPYNYKKWK